MGSTTEPTLAVGEQPLPAWRDRLRRVWHWLSHAPADAPAAAGRRAPLVAGVGVTLLALLALVSLVLLLVVPRALGREVPEALVFLASTPIIVAALYINHRGQTRAAAALLVLAACVDAWGAVLLNRGTGDWGVDLLFYPLLSIVLGGLLLPALDTALVTAGNLALLLFLSLTPQPGVSVPWLGPALFYLAVFALSALASVLRGRDLARLEARERELADGEAKYRRIVDLAQEGIWIVDASARTTFVNRRMADMLGYTEQEMAGQPSLSFIDDSERSQAEASLARRRSGVTDQRDVRLRRKDGAILWAISTGTPLKDEAGQYAGILALVTDVTERRQSEAALEESRQRFESAFQNAAVGMALLTLDGRWQQVNPALCEMLGYTHDEMLAANFQRVTHPADVEADVEVLQKVIDGRQSAAHLEKRYIHKSGRLVWASVSAALVRDSAGQPLYLVSQVQDISERKQALESLRVSGERYRHMFEEAEQLREFNASIIRNMAEGLVVSDGEGRITLVNPKLLAMLGYAEAEMIGMDQWKMVAPRELARARELAVDRPRGVTGAYETTFISKEGLEVPVLISATPLMQNQKFTGTLGVITDIADRKRSEAELQQMNARLSGWLTEAEQRTHDISLLNELGELLQTSQSVEEAFNLIPQILPALFPRAAGRLYVMKESRNQVDPMCEWGAIAGAADPFEPNDCWGLRRGHSHVVQVVEPDLEAGQPPAVVCRHVQAPRPAAYLCIPMMAQNESLGVLHLQRLAASPEGAPAWTEAQTQLARTVADTLAMALASLRLRETLRHQSTRDPLTGLFNRRYLEETLDRELSRVRRNEKPLGVMMLDIDHFKAYNDALGHEAGDQALRAVGNVLRANARSEDIVCRYGGEEFTVILPEASLEITLARGEQVCRAVRVMGTDLARGSLGGVTISVGVACFPEHGDSGADILRMADATLYQAKRAGRDQVLAAVPAF
jgi:diguanylate cyclase (GGDEF)-like protein/PAS domain S-box-containing protein